MSATDAALDSGVATDTANPACLTTHDSTLAGASLVFPDQPCTFTLAEAKAGLSFKYEVQIEGEIDGVVAKPQDAGQCGQPGPSGLIVFGRVAGNGENYCICDTGLCMGPPEKPGKLVQGNHKGTYEWDGVNWFGPSDTGNAKGKAFPPGTYKLELSAVGKQVAPMGSGAFLIKATWRIVLTL